MNRWSPLAILLLVLAVPMARAEDPKPAPAAPPMQAHMQEMERSMDQLQKTTDPTKRRELMREHMAQMQAAMKDMSGMMDCRGAEDCGSRMQGGGMMHRGANAEPMQKQLEAMRRRQNAMQSMMDQMLRHQEQMMKE